MRVHRGFIEGCLRFTYPNPQPTLSQPPMNPLSTPYEHRTNTVRISRI